MLDFFQIQDIFLIQEKTHQDLVYTYIVKLVRSTQNLKAFRYLLTIQRLDIKFKLFASELIVRS